MLSIIGNSNIRNSSCYPLWWHASLNVAILACLATRSVSLVNVDALFAPLVKLPAGCSCCVPEIGEKKFKHDRGVTKLVVAFGK